MDRRLSEIGEQALFGRCNRAGHGSDRPLTAISDFGRLLNRDQSRRPLPDSLQRGQAQHAQPEYTCSQQESCARFFFRRITLTFCRNCLA